MAKKDIPFTKGQHEEIDPHLLPDGLFSAALNVRYQKDGRLAIRSGFRHDTNNATFLESNVIGVGKFDQQHHIILQKRLGDDSRPVYAVHLGSSYFAGYAMASGFSDQQVGSVGVPSIQNIAAGSLAAFSQIGSSDCITIGNFIFVAVSAYLPVTNSPFAQTSWQTGQLQIYKLDPATGAVLASAPVVTAAENVSNVKLAAHNGNVGIFWADNSNNVRYASCNTSLATVQAPVTVVTAVAAQARWFDICPGATSTVVWLVHNSAANTLSFGDVSTAGVYTAKNTIATTNASKPTICRRGLNTTDDCVVAWLDTVVTNVTTGVINYTVYRRSTNTFIVASTSPNHGSFGQTGLGYPMLGESSLDDFILAWCANVPTFFSVPIDITQTHTPLAMILVQPRTSWGIYCISKPFTFAGSNFIGFVGVDRNTAGAFPTSTTPTMGWLIDADANAAVGNTNDPRAEAIFGSDSIMPVETGLLVPEPRRNWAVVPATGIEPALGGAAVLAVPLVTSELGGWGLVRVEYGAYEEMFQSASLNGQLFFSGPRILQYDGATLCDVGFSTPRIISATSLTAGGFLTNGTYLLVAVFEWHDALGNRHQSSPSNPVSVTLTGTNNSILLNITPPLMTIRDSRNVTTAFGTSNMVCKIYRTLAGGTIFQDALATTTLGATFVQGFILIAQSSDATVASQEILYTQGSRGGLSGILENDIPPPARYIWAGSDRLIIGHTDIPTQYQLSKLKFSGEPINWSNTPAFRGNVDKPVTGVAEMDGVYFIGTRDAIWNVAGQGPDDNGGGGSFDTPLRLPSDAGFYSAGSIVLTGQGLMFQGSPDRIYVLPRGGGAPQWIGQPVRDTLAAFPWITSSAYDQDSNLVYFACVNTAGSAGRLLIYDTRISEWSVDNVCNGRAIRSLSIFNGLLVIDGSIIESPGNYQDFDGSVSTNVIPSVTTGDIRLFGQNGWGRIKKAQILGEVRDVATAWTLTLAVSYDSGKTFGETASWTVSNLAAAVGDVIDGAEHMFVTQKTDSVRLRLSITTPAPTEGVVFNGFSLEFYPEDGLKRQANAYRAP